MTEMRRLDQVFDDDYIIMDSLLRTIPILEITERSYPMVLHGCDK